MRRLMAVCAVLCLTGAAVGAMSGSAGAGQEAGAPTTIEKVAVNAPPGTQFTILVECEDPTLLPPEGGPAVDSLELTFTVNEAGEAVPDSENEFFFNNVNTCTVTETDAAGAQSTSYECADNLETFVEGTETGAGFGVDDPGSDAIIDPPGPFCLTFGPQADPISFDVDQEAQEVTVTVTNTFPEPAAEAVEIAPTFTG